MVRHLVALRDLRPRLAGAAHQPVAGLAPAPALAALTPRAQPWVLLPLLAVAVVWLLADLVVVNAATQFACVALLVLAVPRCWASRSR